MTKLSRIILNRNLPAVSVGPAADKYAELVRAWLEEKTPSTLRAYSAAMRQLVGWLEVPNAAAVLHHFVAIGQGETHLLLRRWATTQIQSGLSRATVALRMAAVRSIIDLGIETGRFPFPVKLKLPKTKPRGDVVPYKSEIRGRKAWLKLRAHLEKDDTARGVRDLALFRLMHDCALRRIEAVSIELEHVYLDPEVMAISVLGKGRDEREAVPIGAGTLPALQAWLKIRGSSPGPLFTRFGHGQGPLDVGGISVALASRCIELGIQLRPHDLRRLGITAWLELNGGDIPSGMRFSRHRSADTMMRYDLRRKGLPREAVEAVSLKDD